MAVESGLETLILEYAEAAAERAAASWQSLGPGQVLLDGSAEDLSRASRDFRRRAERAVRDWQQGVLEMVRTEGADKRGTARFLAYGVNGLSVALMIVVFAHTAGVTGAEAGIAGGSAVLGQKLLEAVFGDQAVRGLAERARARSRASGDRPARRGAASLHRARWTVSSSTTRCPTGCATRPGGSRTCGSPRAGLDASNHSGPPPHRLDAHRTSAAEGEHDGLARGR